MAVALVRFDDDETSSSGKGRNCGRTGPCKRVEHHARRFRERFDEGSTNVHRFLIRVQGVAGVAPSQHVAEWLCWLWWFAFHKQIGVFMEGTRLTVPR